MGFAKSSTHRDLPGIGTTIIDGIIRTTRNRNPPPATTVPQIVGH